MQPSTRAEIITRRTYNRPLDHDETIFESWEDTIDRVISHQRWLWERALTHKILPDMPLHDVTEDIMEWQSLNDEQLIELEELREIFLEREALPSGRTLWLGGTSVSKQREASQFNCAHTAFETVYDAVDIFWLLLQGCGVGFTPRVGTLTGFRKPIPNIKVIRSKRESKGGREANEESFIDGTWTLIIGDSAEAWAKSLGKLLAGKYKAHTLVFDFSQIRPEGERLKGYGWISSGDGPISRAYPAIAEILNKRAGSILTKVDIVEICNWLGTVLSSRRSAEIALVEYGSDEWYEFARLKENCYEEGFKHRQQSNNSLVFYQKPTKKQLSELFDLIIKHGGSEPGFINGETAKKRAPWFLGVNPCGEILLPNKGFCNLVEIALPKFKNKTSNLYKAATLVARANYRQTVVDFRDGILQESWHLNNEHLRLCGVSTTGTAQRDDIPEYDWSSLERTAQMAARTMAKELGLQHPKNVTTGKPSGCRIGSELLTTKEGLFVLEELFSDNDNTWEELNLTIPQDNTSNKTLKKFKNGLSDTLKISLSLGMEIQCTPDHKWFVHRRNTNGTNIASKKFSPQWIEARNLQIGKDFIEIHERAFNNINTIYLNTIEQQNYNNTQIIINQPSILNEDISWLLGYLWGDGSLSPTKYRIRFIDQNLYNLEKVQRILFNEFNIDCNINRASQDRDAYVIEIGNKNLYTWIIENGFYKYDIDNNLNNIPLKVRKSSELIIAFIAGLIDSDGCISTNKDKLNRFNISTAQDKFAKHIQDVCWAIGLGIGRSLNSKGKNLQKIKHVWLLTSNTYINDDTFNILTKNSNKIARSENDWHFKHSKRISHIKGKVKAIEYIDKPIETFDIEVENDPWYYAGAIKSHNTLSKIMDTWEGIHKPLGRYVFNWINFSRKDPLVEKLKNSGYKWINHPSEPEGILFCFPIDNGNFFDRVSVTRNDGTIEELEVNKESAVEQLERYKKIQMYYCNQNVSNTISYDPSEKEDIVNWLLENWDIYVGVSFLFRNDPTLSARDLGFDYLPQEVVTKERYEEYVKRLKVMDFTNTDTYEEIENEECAGGVCPIK